MEPPLVALPAYDPANDAPFGPARIEHRTAGAGLTELGTYFMVFDTDGLADPWTLQYEETIYVIEGEARIVTGDDEPQVVVGAPGDLIVLRKGATVQYGGTAGTRLLLSISPVDWRNRLT